MIYLSDEQREKLALIDKIFSSIDIRILREMSESEEIISKLQGNTSSIGPIQRLINDNIEMYNKMYNHDTKIMQLENDIRALVQAMTHVSQIFSQGYGNISTGDFHSLKSRLGIY